MSTIDCDAEVSQDYYDANGRALRDNNGRNIRPGDILKVFHFTERSHRKKLFLHKLVFATCANGILTDGVGYLVGVDVEDIHRKGIEKAHRWTLFGSATNGVVDCEIVGGRGYWWERKRVAPKTAEDTQ